jgi:hypothetical protein
MLSEDFDSRSEAKPQSKHPCPHITRAVKTCIVVRVLPQKRTVVGHFEFLDYF